ncbi:hypothetical protein RJ639_001344 [Escallonia herrerae]|uniref:Pectinesterase inhibitor domain-containing protein n=1 Tax=Escallonia herrerae TaxID=1293975 RepID=A0AA89BFT8_9ASTE|nr:hypothetical protein RJ639_001344 [Escallonia herrerae]
MRLYRESATWVWRSLGVSDEEMRVLKRKTRSHSPASHAFARPNVRAQADDLIGEVWSKTRNPSFCVQALKSDPRSGSADFHGLGQISIDLEQASATATSGLIDLLIKQTNDPKLRERYKSCSENYSDAIGDLGEAKGFLNSSDYGSVNIRASAGWC